MKSRRLLKSFGALRSSKVLTITIKTSVVLKIKQSSTFSTRGILTALNPPAHEFIKVLEQEYFRSNAELGRNVEMLRQYPYLIVYSLMPYEKDSNSANRPVDWKGNHQFF